MDKESAKKAISELVEKYTRLSNDGRLTHYNEEMTKNEFIEPLFEALGWDVRNRKVYDEVIKEHSVLHGRVDYAFRLNGVDRLFVEAKPFRADMDNPAWAKQTIEYGYNQGVAFVILTNFEILRVFNSEWNESNVWRCTVLDLKYTEYLDKFDDLYYLSREATEQNLIVEKANAQGKKIPRKSVQVLLSEQLISWREKLAKNIKSNYAEKYDQEIVDELAQKFIDRLIFIRTCEERNLEDKRLLEAINLFKKSNRKLWHLVKEVYAYYSKEYDSNLFGKDEKDLHELERIDVGDDTVFEIIDSTYKKDDSDVSYNFGDIDADVLGNAYEQYLGYILKTTAKRAKTENGHAHRKEQGIYYTPRYIVDYIVRNTVGEMIKSMKAAEVEKLHILDPACGSGSFLIRAFDEVHNYYSLKEKGMQRGLNDDFDLKLKTHILKNNIFGLDLDSKAVEIAQLNLMLKAAEKRHRLPLLQGNIRHGNSLIDNPEVAGTNAFNWKQNFPNTPDGFDAIIGNPPYGAKFSKNEIDYFNNNFETAQGEVDSYALFIEQGIAHLKVGGYLGFIVPNTFLTNKTSGKLRRYILSNTSIKTILLMPQTVFQDPTVDTLIVILKKEKNEKNVVSVVLFDKRVNLNIVDKNRSLERYNINQREWLNNSNHEITINKSPNDTIISKLEKAKFRIIDVAYVSSEGIKTGNDEKFIVDNKLNDKYKGIIRSRNVQRYSIEPVSEYVYYDLTELSNPGNEELFVQPKKIVLQRIRNLSLKRRIVASLDEEKRYLLKTASIHPKNEQFPLEFILGLLNCKLINYYFSKSFIDFTIKKGYLEKIPVPDVDNETKTRICTLVRKVLEMNHQIVAAHGAQTDNVKILNQQIEQLDHQIDLAFYQIFKINNSEIQKIEASLDES